jgi:hypothetical protein
MEEAVAQRVAQEGLDHRAAEILEVEALGFEPAAVRQRRRLDPFEREHVARGAVPIDRGYPEIRILPGVLRHFGERGGLEPQVHLDGDGASQRVDHFDQTQPPRFDRQALGMARHKREGLEIDLAAMLDAGPQHFHGDRPPPARRCDLGAVDLRDGGGRHRRAERREGHGHRLLERRRDHALGVRLRERRHLVL